MDRQVLESPLALWYRLVRQWLTSGRPIMALPKVRFNWEVNISLLMGGFVFAISFFVMIGRFEEKTNASFEADRMRLTLIERSRAEELGRFNPLINKIISNNNVQDERIANLATALIEMRKTNSEISAKLASISEDLAGIKAQLHISPQRP